MPGPAPGTGGRPRKPVEIKRLEGSRIRPADRTAMEWAVTEGVPTPPAQLDLEAQREWERVAPHLHGAGLLTEVGLRVLESYCIAHSEFRAAVAEGKASQALQWDSAKIRAMSHLGMTPATAGKVKGKEKVAEDPAAEWMRKA